MDPSIIQPKNPNLIETTTPLQEKRSNRQFFCQKNKVSYISYSNGYVRREINAEYTSPYSTSQNVWKVQDQFVLNKRKTVLKSYGCEHLFLETESVYKTQKIIKEHCPQARMDMIDRISSNYKGYTGRFCSPDYTLIVR